MNLANWLFWNVDTQVDFMLPQGKLYVSGAELIVPKLKKLTKLALTKSIRVVSTADFHYEDSKELSLNPDYVETFPPHCMANTSGAKYITETNPKDPIIFEWKKNFNISAKISEIEKHRNIVIRKDAFNVFEGNPFTDKIISAISPETVVVYGVATNVCVNDAVIGLAKRVKYVYVIEDAIKELPNIPLPFETWKKLGVKMITLNDLENLIS